MNFIKNYIQKNKRKIFIALSVVFVVIGFALQKTENDFWEAFGINMINSAFVSFVWTYFLSEFDEESENKKIEEQFKKIESLIDIYIKRQNDLDKMGLKRIHYTRSYLTDNIESILSSATTSIKILGESLNSFLDKQKFERTLENVLKNGVNVKMILCSLNAPALDERYRELDLNKDESIGVHKKSLRTYYKYCKNYSNEFNLKLFKHHPKLVMVIVDDKHVYVQHYSYGMKGYEAPLLEFFESELEIENYYCEIFDNVWNDSETEDAKNEESQFK